MNKCPNCGVKGDVSFCPECGTKMVADNDTAEAIAVDKVCPECGYSGDVSFCPECGTKMVDTPTESDSQGTSRQIIDDGMKDEIFNNAIKLLEEKTSESYQQAISDLEKIGDWRNANQVVEKCKAKLLEIEAIEAEQKAEKEREDLYERALKKFEQKIPKDIKSGIADLESLGDWRDATEVVEKQKAVLGEIEEAAKKKKKKIIKIVGIVAGAIVLAIIALAIIGTALQDDLDNDLDNLNDAKINSLKYQYPAGWIEKDDNSDDAIDDCEHVRYVRSNKDDDSFMGDMYIYYLGDDVAAADPSEYFDYLGNEMQSRSLSVGDTEVDVKEYAIKVDVDQNGEKIEKEATSCTAVFEKDYSSFFVVIEALNDYYDSSFCDELIQKIAIDQYKNPRTAKELNIDYKGSLNSGTEIKSGDENVKVTVQYDNGDSSIATKWTLDKDITLEEGKTSEATVECHGLTGELKVAGRKPIKLTASYSGSTKAGTEIAQGSEDVTVKVEYDTGDKEDVTDWKIDKKIKLKAGETSTAKISAHGLTCDLKVECTTLSKEQYKAKCESRNYKNQLREASYGRYIKIYGQVLQDCGLGYYRISSSGGYDDVYMVYAPDSDIVEDDWCTVYGQTAGIYTYETVMGATQKVPEIEAKYVDR